MFTLLNRMMRHFKTNVFNNRGEVETPPAGTPPETPPAETPSWLEVLPEEAAKDPNITKYKSPEDFYNGYKNMVSMVGKKGVILPGENATEEEKGKFLNAIGRPEKMDGYKIDPVEGLHESVKITPETEGAFKSVAHKIGLTNAQANQLNQWFLKAVNQNAISEEKAQQDAMKNAETALRQEWGNKFDSNKAAVAKLMMKAGGQDLIDAMGGSDGLGNNPIVLKALGKIAGMLSEDQIEKMTTSSGSPHGSESVEDAKNKIKAVHDDKSHAYWNDRDPKHDESVKEMKRLYQIAFPGE